MFQLCAYVLRATLVSASIGPVFPYNVYTYLSVVDSCVTNVGFFLFEFWSGDYFATHVFAVALQSYSYKSE